MLITGTDFNDGAVNYSTCHFVEKERYEQDKHIQIKNGSILITKDGTLGKVAYVQGLSMPATLNAGVFNVEIKDETKVDNKYLFQYLKAPFLMDYVDKKATGGTIKHLNQNILVDFPVVMPSKAEQEAIGVYFQQLDNLITLHQRNSADFVSRFFSDFTNTWEQRKLGDIVGIYDGVHQTPNYQNSGVMFLSVENIATLKSSKFISEEDFKRDYKVYPQENDILMTRIGDVGTTNVVTDNGLKAYYVSLALLKYNSTDPYFLSNAIQSDYVQKGLANRTLKTAIPMKINKDEIGKVSVMLPLSATEQQQIGKYFRSLDHLITLHQCEYIFEK